MSREDERHHAAQGFAGAEENGTGTCVFESEAHVFPSVASGMKVQLFNSMSASSWASKSWRNAANY